MLALSGLTGNKHLVAAQYSRNINRAPQFRTDFSVRLKQALGNGTIVTTLKYVISGQESSAWVNVVGVLLSFLYM
jgi:hypothetical protein